MTSIKEKGVTLTKTFEYKKGTGILMRPSMNARVRKYSMGKINPKLTHIKEKGYTLQKTLK